MNWYTSLIDPSRAPYGGSVATVATTAAVSSGSSNRTGGIKGYNADIYPSIATTTTTTTTTTISGEATVEVELEREWSGEIVSNTKAR